MPITSRGSQQNDQDVIIEIAERSLNLALKTPDLKTQGLIEVAVSWLCGNELER